MGFFAYASSHYFAKEDLQSLRVICKQHDARIKTPVTNINLAAELLKQKYGDHEGTGVYLDILLKENEKLRQKIEQVLLGSKLEFRKRPSFAKMDVHELITDCAQAFHLKIHERNGNLNLELNAQSKYILGDREMLAQAINNIIDNAEKYSPDKPHITVCTIDNGKDLEIIISDNGVGISNEAKSKVFEKFFRVSTGNVHSVKGFGLGLTLVKSVIKKHHGAVRLFSTINQGTEVRIVLPKV